MLLIFNTLTPIKAAGLAVLSRKFSVFQSGPPLVTSSLFPGQTCTSVQVLISLSMLNWRCNKAASDFTIPGLPKFGVAPEFLLPQNGNRGLALTYSIELNVLRKKEMRGRV
jgi:hypothetical protein